MVSDSIPYYRFNPYSSCPKYFNIHKNLHYVLLILRKSSVTLVYSLRAAPDSRNTIKKVCYPEGRLYLSFIKLQDLFAGIITMKPVHLSPRSLFPMDISDSSLEIFRKVCASFMLGLREPMIQSHEYELAGNRLFLLGILYIALLFAPSPSFPSLRRIAGKP